MDIFEPIRRGYHALGFGADADVLDVLDQRGPEPACWEIHSLDPRRVRSRPAGAVAALDLFGGLPAQFELASVRVTSWSPNERHARLVVGGSHRVRVRGTSEAFDLPFSHIWSFADGRVKDVRNLTEGFELRRLPAGASCAAS
jgi:ketosteroid isomerase-like protein